ncbi:MAG: hypothetical protein M0Z52_12540 [Actinomycetota bacterium]|nr:hypothetical protein [Actinomycetota bacterium]
MKKQDIGPVPPAFGQKRANSFKIKNLASKQQPEKQGKDGTGGTKKTDKKHFKPGCCHFGLEHIKRKGPGS